MRWLTVVPSDVVNMIFPYLAGIDGAMVIMDGKEGEDATVFPSTNLQ